MDKLLSRFLCRRREVNSKLLGYNMFFIILRDIKFKVYEVLSKSPDKKAKQLNRLALAVACELERVTGG